MQAIIKLSRRNLLTLLAKLETPGSHCTIVKPGGFVIVAEPDEVHYAGRPEGPGPMEPHTEALAAALDGAAGTHGETHERRQTAQA